MSRTDYRWIRRHWAAIVARWTELLWLCRCDYNNVGTDRCRLCGTRAPRPVRAELATVPVPPRRDLARGEWPL